MRLDPRHEQSRWKKVKPENVREAGIALTSKDAEITCRFCLDRGDEVLVSACPCRGAQIGIHISCLQKAYESKGRFDYPTCPTCKHSYDGRLAVMLLEHTRDMLQKEHKEN